MKVHFTLCGLLLLDILVVGVLTARIPEYDITFQRVDLQIADRGLEGPSLYRQIAYNEFECDMSTVSKVVNHLEELEYSVAILSTTPESIDVLVTDGEISYRLYYKDRIFVILSSPFENVTNVISYINEEV